MAEDIRRVSAALRDGESASDLRRVEWERPERGVVRRRTEAGDPTTERLDIARALLTDHCVVGGWAALLLQGNRWFDGHEGDDVRRVLVHCEPGSRLRRRPSVQPFRGLLLPDEWGRIEGLALTTLARAAFDEMRMANGFREATVVADMACSTTSDVAHARLTTLDRIIAIHRKVRGIVQADRAISLASSRSASPWETRLRLIAQLDAGLACLRVNVPIFSPAGNLLGIADLLDEEAGLVLESDGGHHRDITQHSEDNRREESLERAGLVVARFTSGDHADRRDIVRRITTARLDALSTRRRRAWTTEQPAWWATWPSARRWR